MPDGSWAPATTWHLVRGGPFGTQPKRSSVIAARSAGVSWSRSGWDESVRKMRQVTPNGGAGPGGSPRARPCRRNREATNRPDPPRAASRAVWSASSSRRRPTTELASGTARPTPSDCRPSGRITSDVTVRAPPISPSTSMVPSEVPPGESQPTARSCSGSSRPQSDNRMTTRSPGGTAHITAHARFTCGNKKAS